jgi:hypothetical protein
MSTTELDNAGFFASQNILGDIGSVIVPAWIIERVRSESVGQHHPLAVRVELVIAVGSLVRRRHTDPGGFDGLPGQGGVRGGGNQRGV